MSTETTPPWWKVIGFDAPPKRVSQLTEYWEAVAFWLCFSPSKAFIQKNDRQFNTATQILIELSRDHDIDPGPLQQFRQLFNLYPRYSSDKRITKKDFYKTRKEARQLFRELRKKKITFTRWEVADGFGELPPLTDAERDILNALSGPEHPLTASEIAEAANRGESAVKASLRPKNKLRTHYGVEHQRGAGYFRV